MNVGQPPYSSDCDKTLWLLLTAAYRLDISKAKWQTYSEYSPTKFGFYQVIHVPNFFYVVLRSAFCVIAVKNADDFILITINSIMEYVILEIEEEYTLGPAAFFFETIFSF